MEFDSVKYGIDLWGIRGPEGMIDSRTVRDKQTDSIAMARTLYGENWPRLMRKGHRCIGINGFPKSIKRFR